jgi:hypothetical protein
MTIQAIVWNENWSQFGTFNCDPTDANCQLNSNNNHQIKSHDRLLLITPLRWLSTSLPHTVMTAIRITMDCHCHRNSHQRSAWLQPWSELNGNWSKSWKYKKIYQVPNMAILNLSEIDEDYFTKEYKHVSPRFMRNTFTTCFLKNPHTWTCFKSELLICPKPILVPSLFYQSNPIRHDI